MFAVLSSRRNHGEISGSHTLLASHPVFGSTGNHEHCHRLRRTGTLFVYDIVMNHPYEHHVFSAQFIFGRVTIAGSLPASHRLRIWFGLCSLLQQLHLVKCPWRISDRGYMLTAMPSHDAWRNSPSLHRHTTRRRVTLVAERISQMGRIAAWPSSASQTTYMRWSPGWTSTAGHTVDLLTCVKLYSGREQCEANILSEVIVPFWMGWFFL